MMERRVVITGSAAITPIGQTKEDIWASLTTGTSGVKKMKKDGLLADYVHSDVYGTVDYPIEYDFQRQHRKTMGPVSYYACTVVKRILAQAGLPPEFIGSGKLGVAFGSSHGSPSSQLKIYKSIFNNHSQPGITSISAADYLKSMMHTTAVNITKMFGITGRVIAPCSACTTSSQAIGLSYEMIKFGLQDAMLCGGADEYDTATVSVFDNLLACSVKYNTTPHATPRPFDDGRDGLVVGEGAGALLLEEYEFAQKRGANILAEVIGFSCNNNGGDLILPNLSGIIQTIRLGLNDAQIGPEAVDFVSAHATATNQGDIIEARAINEVYGNRPWVTALKSYMGHTIAACGAIETIITLYMMEKGVIVPTLNLEKVDPACAMIRHVLEPVESALKIAAIQNFAFGGVNTNLILKKAEPLK